MAKKIFNFFMILLGSLTGLTIVYFLDQLGVMVNLSNIIKIVVYAIGIILFAIIFLLLLPKIIKGIDKSTKNMELQGSNNVDDKQMQHCDKCC